MAYDRCEVLCLDLSVAEELRRQRLTLEDATVASARAKALSDPTRLMLAAALAEADELCVCDLSWIAERAENLVSHHLRALRASGLVHSRRDGKLVMYSLTDLGRDILFATLRAAEAVSP